jgi:hypothetical protein
MADYVLGSGGFAPVSSGACTGQGKAGRNAPDDAMEPMSNLSEIRVLALLDDPTARTELEPFDLTVCTTLDEFEARLGQGDADVVIFDIGLGSGWPIDAAAAVAERAGRTFALVILFGAASDLIVVDSRVSARDVWCVTKDAFRPGDLTNMAVGLATLKRVRTNSLVRN